MSDWPRKRYRIAFLQLQELLCAFILSYIVVVSDDAIAIFDALGFESVLCDAYMNLRCRHTCAEHLPTAAANFSIGLVLPAMVFNIDIFSLRIVVRFQIDRGAMTIGGG
jgi:hypothetical protein